MNILNITNMLMDTLNIKDDYIILIIYSIVSIIIYKLIIKLLVFINKRMKLTDKQLYQNNQINKTILSLLLFIIFIYIWHEELKEIITLVSFVSAALTLAVKETIYNYFCGVYIKLKKPIKVEDRIEVDTVIGDVVNINSLSTEVLEVNKETNQSTGIIITIPNSEIIDKSTKNYNTVFKYIWDEINIKVDLNEDYLKCKEILINIINSDEIIKDIPKKMKRELTKNTADYRIYYNNLTPIIYTKIVEDGILFSIRFLAHPKKQRNIESNIYEHILREFNKNNIKLK